MPNFGESQTPKTWAELEGVKSRLAMNMDRVEYLAKARDRLTDMCAGQAAELQHAVRTKSSPALTMTQGLKKSVPNVSLILEDQNKIMKETNTAFKRLEAINKYAVNQETQRNGVEFAEAAKRAARGTQPKVQPYPLYTDLYNLKKHEEGKPREHPMMAVYCSMPYMPPINALRHGRKFGDDMGSTSKTMTM